MRRIGILTGGGDAPGLNAVIRAVVRRATQHGFEVFGFQDGFKGLVLGQSRLLTAETISGILPRGGTILGTTNRDNPFAFQGRDRVDDCLAVVRELGLETIVVIGGDGTMAIASEIETRGISTVNVPKTIDNDLAATDQTFGFDTAVRTATEALDKLHSTAEAHHRIMVLEVMGRYAGWIGLASGLAGGADAILIPEIPFRAEAVARQVRRRCQEGKPFSIVVAAEGALTPEGERVFRQDGVGRQSSPRLGGIGQVVGEQLESLTGVETRVTVLGHLQRGGSPTAYDRILATRYGVAAADLAAAGRRGRMVALRGSDIVDENLALTVGKRRLVDPAGEMTQVARAVGIAFGDEP
ncbi:MAG: 6-phosphofructokinase [Mycobacterium leprae]